MRSYNEKARRRWPYAAVDGEGQFALLVYCRFTVVSLYTTLKQAESALKRLTNCGCDCRCDADTEIVTMTKRRA